MSVFSDLGSLGWGPWLRPILGAGISAAASVISANPIAAVLGAQQFSPRQLGIYAVSTAIVAMAAVLQKSPLPDRRVPIALLPGVHTTDEVEKVAKATAPGEVPTAEVAAAILGKPAPPPRVP